MNTNQFKQFAFTFLLLCFAANCFAWQRPKNHPPIKLKKKFPEKYQDQLEPDSKLLAALYNITVEKTKEGKYIRKQYYPSTKQIIYYETYSNKKLKTLDGFARYWTQNGELEAEGYFKKGKATGEWKRFKTKEGKTYIYSKGDYVKGKKSGSWITYNEDGKEKYTHNYINGKLDRPENRYTPAQKDSVAQVRKERIAKMPVDKNKVYKVVEEMPTFPGCEEVQNENERKRCAESMMLKFVYGNLKYPALARSERIQGRAIVSFVISQTGEIKDIKTLRTPSEEIGLEAQRIIEAMPIWNPGKQRGETVDVKYILPIVFKLR